MKNTKRKQKIPKKTRRKTWGGYIYAKNGQYGFNGNNGPYGFDDGKGNEGNEGNNEQYGFKVNKGYNGPYGFGNDNIPPPPPHPNFGNQNYKPHIFPIKATTFEEGRKALKPRKKNTNKNTNNNRRLNLEKALGKALENKFKRSGKGQYPNNSNNENNNNNWKTPNNIIKTKK